MFVYLGVSTIYYFLNEVISFSFFGLEMAICFISRSINIFGLNFIFKKCMKKWVISYQDLSIVAIGGSIRGSVAFALILTLESNPDNLNQVSVIKSTTLAQVCFTTIVIGGLMPQFIKCILGSGPPKEENKVIYTDEDDPES